MVTKQEKIREGIAERIWCFRRSVYELPKNEWECLPDDGAAKRLTRAVAKEIMGFEDSQGVVLKVERKLPLVSEADVKEWNEATIDGIKTCQRFMLKAGYVATKPLIDAVSSPE